MEVACLVLSLLVLLLAAALVAWAAYLWRHTCGLHEVAKNYFDEAVNHRAAAAKLVAQIHESFYGKEQSPEGDLLSGTIFAMAEVNRMARETLLRTAEISKWITSNKPA